MTRKRTAIERACARCGAMMSVTPSMRAHGRGLYCNRRCYVGTDQERFWSQVLCGVAPDDCWRWLGRYLSNSPGQQYGRMRWGGRFMLAHHISYEIHVGPVPDGKIIRHRCPGGANSWCTNPRHLIPGTMRENAMDTLEHGRHWSQTGAWSPRRHERPEGLRGELRELVVILPRTVHRRLTARARTEGRSLQELAVALLSV